MSFLEEKSSRLLTTNGYQMSSFGSSSDYVIMIWLSFYLYAIVANAWVADDAYITFRTLDNLVNGYGLRWNVTERVQAFTNPLWLFVHVPVYYFTKEVYFTTLLISLGFDAVTFLLVAKLFKTSPGFIFSFLCLPLIISQAFRDYATSGLENPLTFFLITIFCVMLIHRARFSSTGLLFYTSLITALAAVNRLDTVLLYLPVLTFLSISHVHGRRNLWPLLGGFLPLLLWEAFSLFYYGFLFPNTAYAKLSTGIPTRDYVQQGLVYTIDLLKNDPWSAIVIMIAAILTLYSFYILWQHRQSRDTAQWESYLLRTLLGSGLLLYCFYILRVGGDFMSGRFWATPFFLAVLLLNWWLQPLDKPLAWRNYLIGITLALIFVVVRQIDSDEPIVRWSGIANERKFYLSTNGLLQYTRENNVSVHSWAVNGFQLKNEANKQGHRLVVVNQGIGMLGFYAGSEVTIIDNLGLSDSLLARLPVAGDKWRIGHYFRKGPLGYIHVHKTGSLDQLPLSLAQYYQPLHSITTDPLFDGQRLTTILWFNLGKYDHYLEEYIKQNPQDFTSFVKAKG